MRRAHLVVGLASFVAFLLTGQYMDRWLGHLETMADLPRMLYRSGHIYLLFAGLLNVVLGLYLEESADAGRRALSRIGSLLILAAPALLLIGFDREPARTDYHRPYARMAIYASAAGVLGHLVAQASQKSKGKS